MDSPKQRQVFARKTVLGLAIAQIVLGVASVICGAIAVTSTGYRLNQLLKETAAFQAWLEVLFIAAGVLGVIAFASRRVGVIISHMILSIISAVCAVPIIVQGCVHSARYLDPHIIVVVLVAAEFGVALASSILCCRAVCCCGVVGEVSYQYDVNEADQNPDAENTELMEKKAVENETEKPASDENEEETKDNDTTAV